jgi:UrcA family protein
MRADKQSTRLANHIGIGYLKGRFLMNIKTRLYHWTFDRKSLVPAAALAALLACGADSVLADATRAAAKAESVAATVSLVDLDVSTPEGARAANARLAKVAQRLCRKLGDNRRVSDSATYADCYRETLANAIRQLNAPVLAGLSSPITAQH